RAGQQRRRRAARAAARGADVIWPRAAGHDLSTGNDDHRRRDRGRRRPRARRAVREAGTKGAAMRRLNVSILVIVMALAAAPAAAGQPPKPLPAPQPTLDFIGPEIPLGPIVPGAPFSADAATTITQQLGDGTRINRTATAKIFRDASGRVRR